VHGPFDPAAGHRCDPSKLLLDPYGKAFDGEFQFGQALYSYDMAVAPKTPARPELPRSWIRSGTP
jgi:glycogen operon protein